MGVLMAAMIRNFAVTYCHALGMKLACAPSSIDGAPMVDKHRHKRLRAPQGYLPNWVLVVLATGAVVATAFARSLI